MRSVSDFREMWGLGAGFERRSVASTSKPRFRSDATYCVRLALLTRSIESKYYMPASNAM